MEKRRMTEPKALYVPRIVETGHVVCAMCILNVDRLEVNLSLARTRT